MPPAKSRTRAERREGGPLHEQLARQLQERLTQEQMESRLPSLIVGLARDGALVWWGARGSLGLGGDGPATVSTQYRIGSISKTFVAVGVMRLRDEGALDLNDPVGARLPELADLPVTIGQLLSHTSGLRAEPRGPWWERTPGMTFGDLVSSSLRPDDLLWRPGRRFHYSNVGYAVLGEVVARKRSAPLGEVVREELLVPLGMSRTTLRPVAPYAEGLAVHPHADVVLHEPEHDAGAMAPAGQLWSTIADLAIWSEVLAGHHPEILRTESVAEMSEPIAISDEPDHPWNLAYGLGLELLNSNGQRRYGHGGGMPGYWAILLVDQATKDVVVALANSTYQGLRPDFFNGLLSLLGAEQPRPHEAFQASPAGLDRRQQELLGTWYWGPVEYRMNLASDGQLLLKGVPSGRDCSFRPHVDGTYIGQSGYFEGERLEIHRRDDGSPAHLDIASFIFTRSPYETSADIPGGLDERGWTTA
ncbi:MAG TPA: serine hydrolase domain-containing protein [Acidimicrobiales bacterium]|nr:serine hydrolase domain-containing protein [Acidimicrobiales bacterium]